MNYTFFALLAALAATLYLYLTRNFNYWRNKGVPSVPKPYPLFGNLLNFFKVRSSFGEFFKNIYDVFDVPLVGFYVLNNPVLMVRSPDLIKDMFVKEQHKFVNRNITMYKENNPIFYKAMFTSKDQMWKDTRTKLSPVFTVSKIKQMFSLVNDVGSDLNGHVAMRKVVFDVGEMCTKYTTDAVASCILGIKACSFADGDDAIIWKIGRRLLDIDSFTALKQSLYFLSSTLAYKLRLSFYENDAQDLMAQQFWRIFQDRKSSGFVRNDLIDVLVKLECDDGMVYDKTWILAQVMAFFIAGVDTTSNTLSYALYEMCLNKDIQDRLRKEIKENFQTEEDICCEKLWQLNYLSMVVSETLRKYPVIRFLERRCDEDYKVKDADVTIEKGTSIFVSLFGLHHDPKYFPNPEKFDPERFNATNKVEIPPYVYLPFGVGPRICLGERFGLLMVMVGLVHVLYNYELVPTPETPSAMAFNWLKFLTVPSGPISFQFKKL